MERRTQIIIAVCLVIAVIMAIVLIVIFVVTHVRKPKSRAKPRHHEMSEEEMRDFLENEFEENATEIFAQMYHAQWDHETDMENSTKRKIWLESLDEHLSFCSRNWQNVFKDLNHSKFHDEQIKRQVFFGRLEMSQGALEENKSREFLAGKKEILELYSSAKICPYDRKDCNTRIDGLDHFEVAKIFQNSSDYDQLVYLWTEWRAATGLKIRHNGVYKNLLEFKNEQAKAAGFENGALMLKAWFESPTLEQDIDELWHQIEPLYAELHQYVSLKLKSKYGNKFDMSDGLTPAHIFGHLYATSWSKLRELVKPFPENSSVADYFENKATFRSVHDMLKAAFDFYESLGFTVPKKGHVIEPFVGKKIDCGASAWDFLDGKNYRIKLCAEVNFGDFVELHQLMGHVVYYAQYTNQSFLFRRTPVPGFIMGSAGALSLSAQTISYIKMKINMDEGLDHQEDSDQFSINSLMDVALQTVAPLPFALLVDKWRWEVSSGEISEDSWNSLWWEYRKKYQRMKPPIDRFDNKDDFDPGGYYHLINDIPLTDYFISGILQFQLYKSFCAEIGEYQKQQLHKCVLYENPNLGKKLVTGMSLGASKHWKYILELISGKENLDASALLEYFKPLHLFLKKQNAVHGGNISIT